MAGQDFGVLNKTVTLAKEDYVTAPSVQDGKSLLTKLTNLRATAAPGVKWQVQHKIYNLANRIATLPTGSSSSVVNRYPQAQRVRSGRGMRKIRKKSIVNGGFDFSNLRADRVRRKIQRTRFEPVVFKRSKGADSLNKHLLRYLRPTN